jgi:DNA-directed RNA polymerase subunit RPC12/RpoP
MDKNIPISLTCRKCGTKLQWPDAASDSTEIRCRKCSERFGTYYDLRNAALDALMPRPRQKKTKTVELLSRDCNLAPAVGRSAQSRSVEYAIVPGSQGPRREFRISVGLRHGWDAGGRVFDISEAVRAASAWMKRHVEAGRPALSGMFTRAEVTYAWRRDDGTVGSDREPVALFEGEAAHAYIGQLPDATIEKMLNELATELGVALGQERVYLAFAGRTWILDAGARSKGPATRPRGREI